MKSRWAWREQLAVVGPVTIAVVIAFVVAFQWVKPAPPSRVVIATGRADGAYYRFAEQYRTRLAREGITLEVRPTSGAVENIHLLEDPQSGVDIGFVQGGTSSGAASDRLVSLGSLYYEPLWVFSRADPGPTDLRELRGRRLAVGPEGSGTRTLALTLLAANGISPSTARVLPLTGIEAVHALRGGAVDTVFLVAGPASSTVREMFGTPGIALLSFPRADAYTKRFPFLTKLVMPAGGISLESNWPPRETLLLAPAATLVVRTDFHPALVDLILVTAASVHGQRGMFEAAKQFPSPEYLEFPLMGEAERYHKSGPPLLARYLPFWAATLADRVKVLLLPLLVLVPLAPGARGLCLAHPLQDHQTLPRRGGRRPDPHPAALAGGVLRAADPARAHRGRDPGPPGAARLRRRLLPPACAPRPRAKAGAGDGAGGRPLITCP